jgi:hypothetical protein
MVAARLYGLTFILPRDTPPSRNSTLLTTPSDIVAVDRRTAANSAAPSMRWYAIVTMRTAETLTTGAESNVLFDAALLSVASAVSV